MHKIYVIYTQPVQPRRQVNWDAILRALGQQKTFVQLQHYITENPLPDCNYVANNMLMQAEADMLDMVALHHMPNDMPAGLAPLQVEGDRNCFPHTINYLLFKTENRYMEICVQIIYKAVVNMRMYLDDNYISQGKKVSVAPKVTTEVASDASNSAQGSPESDPKQVKDLVEQITANKDLSKKEQVQELIMMGNAEEESWGKIESLKGILALLEKPDDSKGDKDNIHKISETKDVEAMVAYQVIENPESDKDTEQVEKPESATENKPVDQPASDRDTKQVDQYESDKDTEQVENPESETEIKLVDQPASDKRH